MSITLGIVAGFALWFLVRCVLTGFFTVEQNERAVITSFGRAQRVGDRSTLDHPIAEYLTDDHKTRYVYPQVRVIKPGGPYIKMPWQKVHKVNVAIDTASVAWDPEDPSANSHGQMLEAVTKDQLNINISGQLRYRVAEENLYAFLFGVRNPIAHVMGYFVSVLRESIANFTAPKVVSDSTPAESLPAGLPIIDPSAPLADISDIVGGDMSEIEGISINDLRKNLTELNQQMDTECLSSSARYGIVLDTSLITGIDPPQEIEAALAAINTAHNEVSADISLAQAEADQKIEQSKRAVEIQTMRVQAEVEPLSKVADELAGLKANGGVSALASYLRNVRLQLFRRAHRIIRGQG